MIITIFAPYWTAILIARELGQWPQSMSGSIELASMATSQQFHAECNMIRTSSKYTEAISNPIIDPTWYPPRHASRRSSSSSSSILGLLGSSDSRVHLLSILEAYSWGRGTVSATLARSDTDDVRVDRAGDAVGNFDVQFGDYIFFKSRMN